MGNICNCNDNIAKDVLSYDRGGSESGGNPSKKMCLVPEKEDSKKGKKEGDKDVLDLDDEYTVMDSNGEIKYLGESESDWRSSEWEAQNKERFKIMLKKNAKRQRKMAGRPLNKG